MALYDNFSIIVRKEAPRRKFVYAWLAAAMANTIATAAVMPRTRMRIFAQLHGLSPCTSPVRPLIRKR